MDRVFYSTHVRDIPTDYPIYIFDTSFLPQPEEIDYDELITTLLTLLPTHRYVLIMFNCGLNQINWLWGLKFLKKFLINDQNMLHKLISVHDSWFIKSLTLLLVNYSWNKSVEFVDCPGLAELNQLVELKKLKISLPVWRYENNHDWLKSHGDDSDHLYHAYQLFNIIDTNLDKIPMVFLKPGNKTTSMILYNCITSNQLFFINDWDLLSIVSVFKKILANLQYRLIPAELVEPTCIPMSFQNIINYHKKIGLGYEALLRQIFAFCDKVLQTDPNHNSSTLSKCLAGCLGQVSKQDIPRVMDFIRAVVDEWQEISGDLSYPAVSELINHQSMDDLYVMETDQLPFSNGGANSSTSSVGSKDYKTDTNNILLDFDQNINDSPFKQAKIPPLDLQFYTQITSKQPNIQPPKESPSVPPQTMHSSHTRSQSESQVPPEFTQLSLQSDSKPTLKPPASRNTHKQLSDVSNITFGNQKYSIPKTKVKPEKPQPIQETQSKKPVIRGRKVGELAKLFEQRSEGIEILRSM